jgi:di/tricarboxylate transporter
MVYGPGGYVFANFLKFGGPMQIVQMIVSVAVVLLEERWWIGWIVGFGSVFAVFVSRKLVPMIMEKVKGGGNDASSENDDKLDNAL